MAFKITLGIILVLALYVAYKLIKHKYDMYVRFEKFNRYIVKEKQNKRHL